MLWSERSVILSLTEFSLFAERSTLGRGKKPQVLWRFYRRRYRNRMAIYIHVDLSSILLKAQLGRTALRNCTARRDDDVTMTWRWSNDDDSYDNMTLLWEHNYIYSEEQLHQWQWKIVDILNWHNFVKESAEFFFFKDDFKSCDEKRRNWEYLFFENCQIFHCHWYSSALHCNNNYN